MTERLHVVISGRVQGVGYRQSTCSKAIQLNLNGWVRNRSDGRVEAVFVGPRNLQVQMLEWCRQGPSFAKVTDVQANWEEQTEAYHSFEIRY